MYSTALKWKIFHFGASHQQSTLSPQNSFYTAPAFKIMHYIATSAAHPEGNSREKPRCDNHLFLVTVLAHSTSCLFYLLCTEDDICQKEPGNTLKSAMVKMTQMMCVAKIKKKIEGFSTKELIFLQHCPSLGKGKSSGFQNTSQFMFSSHC